MSLRELAAREVLDDETLTSLEVVAFVFSPCRVTGSGSWFACYSKLNLLPVFGSFAHYEFRLPLGDLAVMTGHVHL